MVEMYEDAACLRSVLDKLIETQGKDVVCVLHSYGGMIGTEAIHELLGEKVPEGRGLHGGVVGILYMTAFVLPLGTHLGTAFGGPLPLFIRIEVSKKNEKHIRPAIPNTHPIIWALSVVYWTAPIYSQQQANNCICQMNGI